MDWLITILGIMALIVLHELGHFAAAKAVGMRVERFSLFFPPKIVGIKRGETEYMIGALPLGGLREDHGHEPRGDRDLAARGRPASLLRPSALEAHSGDLGGPRREPGDRFRSCSGWCYSRAP